ncbi:MAG: hypothetical protein A2381_00095 [Bdellovibrionales bacterium RIFOXYB1_FULL_37_110]|nr:MAG: hypothetical protein A2181_06105 [Bdellovibrionales bacterium RIFOXYA1_FULL_38_20]OFZ49286.1 MAG: hypothetical protein A2417_17280 [Bdellovibrionales bacterium RIFOXYC1_FULL_37_79]OFZ57747.1 MAG: hypothetical protein A2381_00095 [Bdellovibrionales bacterium RIFOXYB1_FULL_37_110]OFZ61547.1 MAG: hypothetical protein A2577_00560 [Bdellovibrionales bacterium RIFOXYD1_FULL_36_51]
MFKINKKIIYSLLALKYISSKQSESLTSAQEISDSFHIPFDTTAKVLQSLHRINILDSTKGVKGGYQLNKKLSEISYMDILRTVNEHRSLEKNEIEKAQNEDFALLNITLKLNLKVNEVLSKLFLDEILEKNINLDDLKIIEASYSNRDETHPLNRPTENEAQEMVL